MLIPIISVIIVNYNGFGLLKECLDSLRGQTFRDFEIILVDNASSDGSVELVEERYPEVSLIKNRKNYGYGIGNNRGIAAAKGKYIVLLNNDANADPHFLEALIKTAGNNNRVGMFAPKILNYFNRDIIDSAGLIMYRDGIARGRGRLEKDRGQYNNIEEVIFPSGCACLYSREMLNDIGSFDEDLFLYLDDVDMGLRARIAGWKCKYVPNAIVYHKYSATTKPYSALKGFMVERNRIWIMIKYFPISMIVLSPFFTIIRYAHYIYGIWMRKGIGIKVARSEPVYKIVWVIIKAYFSAFKGVRNMLKKRNEMIKLKRVSNDEITEWFRRFGLGVKEVSLKE